MEKKFIAHSYMETTLEQTDEKVLVVTLESRETGTARFVVPIDSQISNRVKYFVDNGIKDFLETDLTGNKNLIDVNDFSKHNQRNRFGESESVYFHKSFNDKQSAKKILSIQSIINLEKAFENTISKTRLYNSNVLCQLRSDDGEANIYLISKFEDEDKFIAIVETEFTKKLEMEVITLSGIRELGVFSEIPISAFSIKAFLETGQKIVI